MKIFTIALLALSLNLSAQIPSYLNANASAQPDNVCAGNSIQLSANVTGGSQNYTYTWSSIPEGFTSIEREPVVSPQVSTVYYVEVNDGSNTATGNVTVTVRPAPVINLMPENVSGFEITSEHNLSTCPFNSIKLDAKNPGCSYLWSTGSTDQTILAQTSGITFDYQEFTVLVTDPITGCSSSDFISVNFDYSFCAYGLDEKSLNDQIKVYPNPSNNGLFFIELEEANKVQTEVYTSTGLLIRSFEVSRISGSKEGYIDLSDEASGLYLLKLCDGGSTFFKKLIIQR